jgi:hypothetical protein
VWEIVIAVLITAAVFRWGIRRDPAVDPAERIPRAFEALHHRRRAMIGEAPEGPVLIRGKVSARRETLTSPMTQQDCVYFDLRVDNLMAPTGTPGNPDSWGKTWHPSTAVLKRRDARPFLVTDETGTAVVAFADLAELSFVVAPETTWSGRKLRESVAVQEALSKLGVAHLRDDIAVHEAALFVGDEVSVVGVGRREVTPDGERAGFRSPPMEYVVRPGGDDLLAVLKPKG